jgi:transcription antitermination protein NusB
MKTRRDPRHLQRQSVMQELFAWDFESVNPLENLVSQEIVKNLDQIDKLIEKSAPSWPISKINKVDLAILRQAVFELTYEKDAPPKVVVDEAVELAKEYGSDSSPSFINGALGKLISEQKLL